MWLNVKTGNLEKLETSVIVLPITKGKLELVKKLSPILYSIILEIKKDYEVYAEEGSFNLIYTHSKMKAEKLVLLGMGDAEKVTIEKIRKFAGAACSYLRKKKFSEGTFIPPLYALKLDKNKILKAAAEGILLGNYSYNKYKTDKEAKEKETKLAEMNLFCRGKERLACERIVQETTKVVESVYLVRDLVNGPANLITPSYISNTAKDIAKQHHIKCNVLGLSELKKENMNLMIGVAKGSAEKPKFIVLDYHPKTSKKTIALVGKGVCFDSGGLDIKPPKPMADMKDDMAGAAIVLGTIKAAAELQLPVRIIGFMPCVENMPGGRAQKPGDILVSASGKTVEVLNTDAEGRLILADALHYATKYKPEMIIDIATLTGACIIALGSVAAGLLYNNKKLSEKLIECGNETYERVWPLPLFEEYSEMIKSDIADIKNIGNWDYDAGAITAAAFLKEFVGNTPWMHIDIAGVVMSGKDNGYTSKGATGYGVRLLVEFLKK